MNKLYVCSPNIDGSNDLLVVDEQSNQVVDYLPLALKGLKTINNFTCDAVLFFSENSYIYSIQSVNNLFPLLQEEVDDFTYVSKIYKSKALASLNYSVDANPNQVVDFINKYC